jgi:hypothetical protein
MTKGAPFHLHMPKNTRKYALLIFFTQRKCRLLILKSFVNYY